MARGLDSDGGLPEDAAPGTPEPAPGRGRVSATDLVDREGAASGRGHARSGSSGLPVPHRVDSAAEVAGVLANRTRERAGVLVGGPIPEAAELDPTELDAILGGALADCDAAGITGAAITPFVLGRIGEATDGRSVPANLALAENNARVAAEIAVAIAG